MRKIKADAIVEAVSSLCVKANLDLRPDVRASLERALAGEPDPKARKLLGFILENARVAREDRVAICQDTGMPVVFVEIGRDVDISGLDMEGAVQRGIAAGYRRGYLRNSIVRDPLARPGGKFAPGIAHFDFVRRPGLRIEVLPKGFGSENKSKLCMFNPTVSLDKIKDFIVSSVREAGPDACPPYIIGVGIGGTADYACLLAKKALLKKIKNPCLAGRQEKSKIKHTPKNLKISILEYELLEEINKLNIGPMGLGGRTTALGVNIALYPTHIAGLPVAVNISCHALRTASIRL